MYKITIEKVETELKKTTTYEKLHDKDTFDTEEDPQYGYVKAEIEQEVNREIYNQITEKEIDIKQVIDAFNQ